MTTRVTIRPRQPSVDPGGPPPVFEVTTDGLPFAGVQVATDPFLLTDAGARRRTQDRFFDSWWGDERALSATALPPRREVPGVRLRSVGGRVRYQLPAVVWDRLKRSSRLCYRAVAAADEGRRRPAFSTPDADWLHAPAILLARLPAATQRNAQGRFGGRLTLSRPDFLVAARAAVVVSPTGAVAGTDGDFSFAVLDANRFDLTVLECHEWGLTDTVDEMRRRPTAVINGQFISAVVGVGTEGQTIREGLLANADSQPTRYFVAQTWGGADASSYRFGRGDPSAAAPPGRAAFGGLGPLLLGGAPVTSLTGWARSLYDRDRDTGRGAIAVHRGLGLIVLVVQRDIPVWSRTVNAMTMTDLRDWLRRQGVEDAVFNDGSDSESLWVNGGWLLTPGLVKDEVMDFAVAFTDRRTTRRVSVLAIDGTRTADGDEFARGVQRPLTSQYGPANLAPLLRTALPAISGTFQPPPPDGPRLIEAWRARNQTQAGAVARVFADAGAAGNYADILYVSTHAWRHGELWYLENDRTGMTRFTLANPWTPFRPAWRTTPQWLILAGCSVLSLRYTRCIRLTADERAHLTDWHRDIHGPRAAVPGLTAAKRTLWATYHPGWRWCQIFRDTGLRGVLGYWYRSPSGGTDEAIVNDFAERLREGATFREAWEVANSWTPTMGIPPWRGEAEWACMIRAGAENDRLSDLENRSLTRLSADFRYYDDHQTGRWVGDAYLWSNRLGATREVGSLSLAYHGDYDDHAADELDAMSPVPTAGNLLVYDDGVRP